MPIDRQFSLRILKNSIEKDTINKMIDVTEKYIKENNISLESREEIYRLIEPMFLLLGITFRI